MMTGVFPADLHCAQELATDHRNSRRQKTKTPIKDSGTGYQHDRLPSTNFKNGSGTVI
jgi:hypothetical protein